MKAQVMFAVYTNNRHRTTPLGIFAARWKAKDAIEIISHLYNSRNGFRVERVWVEYNEDQSYTVTAHTYKRVTPKQMAKI